VTPIQVKFRIEEARELSILGLSHHLLPIGSIDRVSAGYPRINQALPPWFVLRRALELVLVGVKTPALVVRRYSFYSVNHHDSALYLLFSNFIHSFIHFHEQPVGCYQFGTNQNSHLQSYNSKLFSSLDRAKPSTPGQVWTGDEGKVPSSNNKYVPSQSGTSSYYSGSPATPNREDLPRVSKYLELTPPRLDYANKQQLVLDYVSGFTPPNDAASDVPLMALLCRKVMEENQKCDALTIEVQSLRKQLAIAQSDSNFSEQAIRELAVELGLMGPRLGLAESQKILNRDVGAILASGGMPPLDITLDGWTYIRVGKPGENWKGDLYDPIEPFPPGRRPYTGGDSSPLLPPKRTYLEGNSGTGRPQPSYKDTSGAGGRLPPPALPPRQRNTWAGESRFSPVQGSASKPLRTREGSLYISPLRPTHRHDAASASPGISSRYFNWTPDKNKQKLTKLSKR